MTEGWRPGTVPLTVADVADLIPNHKVVVVHFWARWNGVDRQFASVLDAVRPEFEGRITFRSADVDDPELATFCRECEVVNVPALGCFVDGRRVKTIVGSRPVNVAASRVRRPAGGEPYRDPDHSADEDSIPGTALNARAADASEPGHWAERGSLLNGGPDGIASSTGSCRSIGSFPVLAVADLDAAVEYCTVALGFHELWRWGEPPVRAGVARDEVELQSLPRPGHARGSFGGLVR